MGGGLTPRPPVNPLPHLQCTDQRYTAEVNGKVSIKGGGLKLPGQCVALLAFKEAHLGYGS